jgi:F0F1-type ATP synthase assembly protein I
MTEPENNPPRRTYQWPWFALGFVVLGIALAIFWVALAAKKIEQQRDLNAPLPSAAPAR